LKLEFPKFDGENLVGWQKQAEKCFTLATTPMDQRVHLAEIFLIGKADHWLRSTGINTADLTWHEFANMINTMLAAESSMKLIDSFIHTEQTTSVSAYIDCFEELMGKIRVRNPSLTEEYFVGCFVSGLKDYIKVPLRSHAPLSLVQSYALARNYEHSAQRRNDNFKWKSSPVTRHQTEKSDKPEDKLKSSSRWGKGKCFKCQEPWVPSHNKVCKFRNQVDLISIQDGDSSEKETTILGQAEDTHDIEEGPKL
jgi:hypothetical protein